MHSHPLHVLQVVSQPVQACRCGITACPSIQMWYHSLSKHTDVVSQPVQACRCGITACPSMQMWYHSLSKHTDVVSQLVQAYRCGITACPSMQKQNTLQDTLVKTLIDIFDIPRFATTISFLHSIEVYII